MILETERLILRPWRDADRAPLAAILGDAHVRRFYLRIATREDTDAAVDKALAQIAEYGFSFQAVERKSDDALLGLLGIAPIPEANRLVMRGHPEVEIGWQLDKACWGQGYAPEAARAWLAHAWSIGLPEVVAYTAAQNLPSQRVMEKLGMTRDPDSDFDHPAVPEGHVLRPHILYRIANPG